MGKIKRNSIIKRIIIMTAFAALISVFSGCGSNTCRVDYCGQEALYRGHKERYEPGEQVEFYYKRSDSDGEYTFFLGEKQIVPVPYSEDEDIIWFVMPDKEVKLERVKNSEIKAEHMVGRDILLVNYYRETVAAADGDGYFEMVLSTTEEADKAALNVYRKDEGEDETCRSYIVPFEAVERCYQAIIESDMRGWNELENSISADGALTVCKFRFGDTVLRITSESMPADGEAALDNIREIMSGYMQDAYFAGEW